MPENICRKNEIEIKTFFTKNNIANLLNIIRTLYEFCNFLDSIISNKKAILKISKYELTIEDGFNYRQTDLEQFEDMIRFSDNNMQNMSSSQNEIEIKKELGYTTNEIKLILEHIMAYFDKGIKWWIFDKTSFFEFLKPIVDCTECCNKLISYLILDKGYTANSGFSNAKFSRQPIIEYSKDTYCTSMEMFCIGILFLLRDLKTGQTLNSKLNQKLQPKIHENRINFELEVIDRIKRYYPTCQVKHSTTHIQGIELPGEIDILCLHRRILYVLECKASSLKVNVKEEQNHIRKFTLDKGKSFTYKLHKKIEFLNNNIELLKEEFGIDEILSIKGAFILRYPSMILQIKDLKYPIIHISQIERLFND